jgi:hypothetical protein
MEEVIIAGVKYVPEQQADGAIKIVILQRGWCMVGRFERDGSECKLYNASVIRKWGTQNGLGEIAANGPTEDTVLDACNNGNAPVEFDYLTVVACLPCMEDKWQNKL